MTITEVSGVTYGINPNTKKGDANRYVAAVKIVASEEPRGAIITTNVKSYQADVFGVGETLALARAALTDALEAACETNEPERAVASLAAKMAQDKAQAEKPS